MWNTQGFHAMLLEEFLVGFLGDEIICAFLREVEKWLICFPAATTCRGAALKSNRRAVMMGD
jgi:hypothetical protein